MKLTFTFLAIISDISRVTRKCCSPICKKKCYLVIFFFFKPAGFPSLGP